MSGPRVDKEGIMSVRFISSAFLILLILFSTQMNAYAEDIITPNLESDSPVSVEPINPSVGIDGAWQVDDIGVIRVEGKGTYEVMYSVDGVDSWSGRIQLPYDFKTTFRGLKEGEHSIKFELKDELGNVIEKSFIANVKH